MSKVVLEGLLNMKVNSGLIIDNQDVWDILTEFALDRKKVRITIEEIQ